ncbi:bacteriohemerythrin [Noviherbaspirillum sp.]|uniref:bacteriohemerythrin n=1 Tax=Noviherbaspirillum sp. TaxID=1926288 RepID=UPI002D62BD4D|nr:bacteriohemerythrin [Noviherbaspirillum sp.]HZW20887.1 bacteriohemerythrin [Noviherbaspirillum sp.]
MLETTAWSTDLAIGHEVIDADHRHIFETADALQAEMREDEPAHSIVGKVLVGLIEHTGGHFAREEALMQESGFPGSDAHKREHALLMQKVNALHRRFMDGCPDMAAEVADFIQHGLVRHIMKSDMELGRHVRKDT